MRVWMIEVYVVIALAKRLHDEDDHKGEFSKCMTTNSEFNDVHDTKALTKSCSDTSSSALL